MKEQQLLHPAMRKEKNQLRIIARRHSPPSSKNRSELPPTVSPRWLMAAVSITLAGAALCAWGTLCLLFWQGGWQLLYHPKAVLNRTPSSMGIRFEPVSFATAETGQPRIQGWWIPASQPLPLNRFNILYLHGATGNLGDSVEELARLHVLGVNVLAFDYRGYGQSQFAHPSESRWLEDANLALDYLVQTRHLEPHSIAIAGHELGADLAVELAATHPELAGVIVDSPVEDPASVIFNDSRAHMVPARLLVKDRYDLDAAASRLRIPSLWLLPSSTTTNAGEPSAFGKISAPHQLERLQAGSVSDRKVEEAISQWLISLPNR
jgi:uncharacterized protein